MKYISVDKPETCPKCGSEKVVNILYGYPTHKGNLEAAAGRIILGGCVLSGNDPRWGCIDCNTKNYEKKSKS